jgi:Fe-S-cluster-containing hydrogenase component 2
MRGIAVNWSKCVGCRLCELACSLKNTGEFNPVRARIQVIGFDEFFCVPVLCLQCERPYCAEICPSGAIINDETGTVRVLKQRCTGCKMCILACPFGNIVFSKEAKTAVKCELCDGEPECVLFCPTAALEFRELETTVLHKKVSLSEKLKAIYEGIK